ncbi:MAG TPA: hypothetical protein VFX05_17580, partial [Casimicrobiaceae bacterium]|nr:hypothetical protein [Casimicrobiaceae bacterium]
MSLGHRVAAVLAGIVLPVLLGVGLAGPVLAGGAGFPFARPADGNAAPGPWGAGPASVVLAKGKPGTPLVCHKEVCPLPTSSCQALASDRCVKGRCPAIVDVPDGTACSLAAGCTVGDACRSGSCTAGQPLVCTSPTATCSPFTGCATACGANGCTVEGGGSGNPTLTVPVGALANSVLIKINDLGGDANDPSVFRVYELLPGGTQFSPPATIDLPAP